MREKEDSRITRLSRFPLQIGYKSRYEECGRH